MQKDVPVRSARSKSLKTMSSQRSNSYCYNAWNQEISLHLWLQGLHGNLHLAKHWPAGTGSLVPLANSGLPCHYVIWQILNFGFVPKDI